MMKKMIDRIMIFNLITGKEPSVADNLFNDIFGENDRYDEFSSFCDKILNDKNFKPGKEKLVF